MPHLHLSVQAGDDLILKRMKRRHLRAHTIDFCNRIRRLRPEIAFGADLIAGFPTETDEMFARTVTLKLRYSDFTTITRSHSEAPTQDGDGIERRAVALLDRTDAASRPVRLLGVSVHNFIAAARVTALPDGWLPFEG